MFEFEDLVVSFSKFQRGYVFRAGGGFLPWHFDGCCDGKCQLEECQVPVPSKGKW